MTVVELHPAAQCREIAGIWLAALAGDAATQELPTRWHEVDGRRIAWRHIEQSFNVYEVADEAARWAAARVDLLIVSGAGSRALAVAARDAGLQLSQVVVCRDRRLASDVVIREAAPDDGVVLSEIDADLFEQLSAEIAVRWGAALSADVNPWNMPVAA